MSAQFPTYATKTPLSPAAARLIAPLTRDYPDSASWFFATHRQYTLEGVRAWRSNLAAYVDKKRAEGFRVGASVRALATLDAVIASP